MLGLGGYFFFYQGGFWQVDRATMMRLFDFAPGALCLVVPLVTMRLLAEEKRTGTLELLITLPVKDSEVILGKYLAALGDVHHPPRSRRCYPIAMFVCARGTSARSTGVRCGPATSASSSSAARASPSA